MDKLITVLCALIGSGAATALINGLFARRAEEEKKETGESQGIRWLMQDRLEHVALAYMAKGSISYDELKNWNRGHHIYHDLLGGNGDLDPLKTALQTMYKGDRKI